MVEQTSEINTKVESGNKDAYSQQEVDAEELKKNPNIFSTTDTVNKNSFVDFRQAYDQKCPPPRYLTKDELLEEKPTDKESIFK